MVNGVLGSHGPLAQLLAVEIQPNIPRELVIVQHPYTVY